MYFTMELISQFDDFVRDIVTQTRNVMFRDHNLRRTRDLLLPKPVIGDIDVSKLKIAGAVEI